MSLLDKLLRRSTPEEMGPLYPQVKDAMHEVQAYARSHGGMIELVAVTDEGDVRVRLKGTCRDCPMSAMTLRLGVAQRLKLMVPGVRNVEQVD
jgi:Fe-S cluster biogenesis protein NfuA